MSWNRTLHTFNLRASRKARGVCVDCEGALDPGSSRYCPRHKEQRNTQARALRERRVAVGACWRCGFTVESGKSCRTCKWKDAHRKRAKRGMVTA